MKTSLKTYIKNTLLCIKYPFLYPRNRWDDKYHPNLLCDKLYELDKQSSMLVGVSISLERDAIPECYGHVRDAQLGIEVYLTEIITSSGGTRGINILNIVNENSAVTHNLNDQLGRPDKFEVIGISIEEHLKLKYIKVHVRLKDETDKTNYGFPYYTARLITDAKARKKFEFWNWVDKKVLDKIFIFPHRTEWDALKPYEGWYNTFGKDLLDELRKQLVKEGLLYKFRIRDIKEKWGVLEIYSNYRTDGIVQILDKYRSLSKRTCVYCGKPVEYCTKGWIRYLCGDCINKSNNKGYTKVQTSDAYFNMNQ